MLLGCSLLVLSIPTLVQVAVGAVAMRCRVVVLAMVVLVVVVWVLLPALVVLRWLV